MADKHSKKTTKYDDVAGELAEAFGDVADALGEMAVDLTSVLGKNATEGAKRFREAIDSAPRRESAVKYTSPVDVRAALSGTRFLFSKAMRVFLSLSGAALVLFSVIMLAFCIDMFMVDNIGSGVIGVAFTVFSAFGAAACLSSAKRSRIRDTYLRYIGDRPGVAVAELASAMRKSEKTVRTELAEIIRKGGFQPGYLSPDGAWIFLSSEAYREYMQEKAAAEEQNKAAQREPAPQVRFEEEELLRQLAAERRRIDEIPVRSEVEKLESSAAEIFSWVRRHPSDASQVRRVTSYYLPTTLKLLRTYNEMDLHAESSAVAEDIQNKIHTSLVNVNEAFSNLRDTLLRDTALDVDAEISALSTVLAQEGLVQDEITKH